MMNVGKKKQTIRLSSHCKILIMLLILAQATFSQLPEKSFACQVQNSTIGIKLKLVQANSRDEAIRIAYLDNRIENEILDVIECVVIGEEKFKDKIFQKEFNNTPR